MPNPLRTKPPEPASPARRALAAALQALHTAERAHAATAEPIARLESEIEAEAAAQARLASLDTAHAERMAAWAGSPSGTPPDPDPAQRRDAEAALSRASARASAARTALGRWRHEADQAAAHLAEASAKIKPAVAAVLREEGRGLVADYWRHWAAFEQARRDLAALDQVLIADFPAARTAAGRKIVTWLSPDRGSAADLRQSAEAATALLASIPDSTAAWRTRAAELMTG